MVAAAALIECLATPKKEKGKKDWMLGEKMQVGGPIEPRGSARSGDVDGRYVRDDGAAAACTS